MKTNPNEPINVLTEEQTDRIDAGVKIYTGLTKREYFAAMAMQGLIVKYQGQMVGEAAITRDAVSYSDALIKCLKRTTIGRQE